MRRLALAIRRLRLPAGGPRLFGVILVPLIAVAAAAWITSRRTGPTATVVSLHSERPADAEPVETVHHFGLMRPGQRARHQFEIRNDTGAPLTFAELRSSCSCTVAAKSGSTILPGASEYVDVVYTAPESYTDDRPP